MFQLRNSVKKHLSKVFVLYFLVEEVVWNFNINHWIPYQRKPSQ